MKTIEIEESTFSRLAKVAAPLEGADAVIKRLLDDFVGRDVRSGASPGPNHRSFQKPASDDEATPEAVFYPLLMQVLADAGGRSEKAAATRRIGEILGERLTEKDKELVTSGEARWENKVAWGRNHLKELGLISAKSVRGVWELTDRGMELSRTKAWPESWSKA